MSPEALIPEMPMPLGAARNVRLLVLRNYGSRLQQSEIEEEPAIQRNLHDLAVSMTSPRLTDSVWMDEYFRSDCDQSAGVTEFEHRVDATPLIDCEHDFCSHALKPGALTRTSIVAGTHDARTERCLLRRSVNSCATLVSVLVSVTAAPL